MVRRRRLNKGLIAPQEGGKAPQCSQTESFNGQGEVFQIHNKEQKMI